ncbi:MAG: c-type cytochrome [bacterium]
MQVLKNIQSLFLSILILVSLMAWFSCRGDGVRLNASGDPEGASGFAAQIQPIFDTNCIRCHASGGIGFIQTGGSQNNGLNLTSGNSHASLVNQPTFQAPTVDPKMRVAPGDPDGSYLIQKISSASPKAGRRMPFDGPPFLSQSEIQLIRDWIAQGAPNN